ncbi:tetratricopeptide repeat protein [Thiohalomonas denitrificans]|nr:hypothetical protein [Thiohalomonas denitrificans]
MGGVRFFFVLLMLTGTVMAVDTSALDDAARLARAGAPQLALSVLDRSQPNVADDPEAWSVWQRKRAAILRRQGAWEELAAELKVIPDGVPPAYSNWAATERVQALLHAGEAVAARQELAERIWQRAGGAEELRRWRQLVIRSYIVEGRPDDAYIAMLRHRQEYRDGGTEDALLRARVLLGAGRPADAAAELTGTDDSAGQALLALARLRSGAEPGQIAAEAARRVDSGEQDEARLYWRGVAIEAAAADNDSAALIQGLEPLVAQGRDGSALRGLVRVDSDRLWEAYLDYARQVGNREQLLMGDDAAWQRLAATDSRKFPIRARSIYVLLSLEARSGAVREHALERLAENITSLPSGDQVLHALYRQSDRFGTAVEIPATIRRILADRAVARSDLAEAAKLMKGLRPPATEKGKAMWELRRAKIFLLGGEYQRGEAVLTEMAGRAAGLETVLLDRFVQVIFDLQTLGRHDAAYDLFQTLYTKTTHPRLQRELLYWMADSRKAQGNLRVAARLYLQSAILPGVESMDPWAQTARYEAAKALSESGLFADAEVIYRQLLKVTESSQRRAVLARELEQLRLRKAPSYVGD